MTFILQTWVLWALQIVAWPLQVAYSIIVPVVYAIKLRKWRVLTIIPYDLANDVIGLLGCFVLPVVLRLAPSTADHLPKWCWMWDNDWDTINGDAYGWMALTMAAGVDQRSYIARLNWLCVRNGTANFSRYTLGFQITPLTAYKHIGDWIDDNTGDHSGSLYVEATHPDGRTRFCYASLTQWGSSRRCIRTYLGWKMMGSTDGKTFTPPPAGNWCQEDVYWNPYFGFNPAGTTAAGN